MSSINNINFCTFCILLYNKFTKSIGVLLFNSYLLSEINDEYLPAFDTNDFILSISVKVIFLVYSVLDKKFIKTFNVSLYLSNLLSNFFSFSIIID